MSTAPQNLKRDEMSSSVTSSSSVNSDQVSTNGPVVMEQQGQQHTNQANDVLAGNTAIDGQMYTNEQVSHYNATQPSIYGGTHQQRQQDHVSQQQQGYAPQQQHSYGSHQHQQYVSSNQSQYNTLQQQRQQQQLQQVQTQQQTAAFTFSVPPTVSYGSRYTPKGAINVTTHTNQTVGLPISQQVQSRALSTQGSSIYTTQGSSVQGAYVTGGTTTSSRTVTGEERIVGVSQRVDNQRSTILSERVVEHEIKVPKKIIREDVIERIVVVPEKIVREELVEETQTVKETIVEVAKHIIQEKVVEVPERTYVDKLVEYPEKIFQEKIKEVPRIEIQERITEIPKYITQERIVEVPEIEYREYTVEKVVEDPEIREHVVTKEVPVPQYIDKPVPQYVNIEVPNDIQRNIPVTVEAVTTFEYRLPQFRPRINKIQYPLYVPRFVEVPLAKELFDAGVLIELESQSNRLAQLGISSQPIGLCDVETLALDIKRNNVQTIAASADLQTALKTAWKAGRLSLTPAAIQTNLNRSIVTGFSTGGMIQSLPRQMVTTTTSKYGTGTLMPSSILPTTSHLMAPNSSIIGGQTSYHGQTSHHGSRSSKREKKSKSSRSKHSSNH